MTDQKKEQLALNSPENSRLLKIGLVINPLAGIGGAVALKGSDGEQIVSKAKDLGARSPAPERAVICLRHIVSHLAEREHRELIESTDNPGYRKIRIYLCAGSMGADILPAGLFGLSQIEVRVVYDPGVVETTVEHTRQAVRILNNENVDLLLFAGGDGTARDIASVIDRHQVVLGIPSGVKMHSGVFANNPQSAARVVNRILDGELVTAMDGEVRDIDEEAFREGRISASYYGSLLVPEELRYIQHVKSGGREQEALVVEDIASYILETMEDDQVYFIGSGSTPARIMEKLGLANTLLGIDVVKGGRLLLSDAREDQLFEFTRENKVSLIITVIGGQGHIIGRGNQQLSPRVLGNIGRSNVIVIATKSKLADLKGRPLLIDSGSEQLDQQWSGLIRIVTGYEDTVLYPLDS